VTHSIRTSALAIVLAAGWALPVHAQTQGPGDPLVQPAVEAPAASATPAASPQSEWSIKPRGRVQVDFGTINAPTLDLPVNQAQLGPDMRIRRAYLGVDITIPGRVRSSLGD
jgi:hypothetical protein